MGAGGATLRLTADGGSRPALCRLPGWWDTGASGSTPVSGSGVWHVGVFDSGALVRVIFEFADGSQAELQLKQDGSALALFYDLGDSDEGSRASTGPSGIEPGWNSPQPPIDNGRTRP